MSFVITDPSIPLSSNGLTIMIFAKSEDKFPQIEVGSVMKCSIKIQGFNNRIQGISNSRSEFLVLGRDSVVSQNQIKIYDSLREYLLGHENIIKHQQKPSINLRPLLKITNVRPSVLCDVKAKVVFIEEISQTGCLSLIISDFTRNELLSDIEKSDSFSSFGIPSVLLIQLILWDEHVRKGKGLKVGDYGLFKNLRPKFDQNGRLEFYMHGDRPAPSFSTKISLLSNDDIDVIEMKR